MINNEMYHLGKESSVIRQLFEEGKVLKEKYGKDNVYDFSIGNPSVPCPKEVNNALVELLNNATYNDSNPNGDNFFNSSFLHGYTSASGDKNVKNEISNYLNKKYSAFTSGDLIYLTSGAAAGLAITLKSITNNNENEIIVFAPFFPEYSVFINNAGAKIIKVNPDKKTFYPDLTDFKNKINNNTTAIIINSPNNPTGVLYKEDIIKKICEILKSKEKEYNHPIYIISDEPYRDLIYTSDKYPFITNYYNNSIITYSFSKSISIPGERIGYILVNKNCINATDLYYAICGAGRSLGYVCAPSLFQYAIPKFLGRTSDLNIYKNNAKLLYDNLTRIGYEAIFPDGAFYLFVKALEDDDSNFSKTALKYNLLLVPSESFGIKGYIRIAYCISEKQIRDSLPKFNELYCYYKSNK